MSVQRINIDVWESPIGQYVTYADHVAALAEAEQQFNETLNRLGKCNGCQEDLDYVRAEALREARDAVAAFLYSVDDDVESILAAIDALKGEAHD